MERQGLPRRDFLKMLAVTFSAASFDWDAFPIRRHRSSGENEYDAIIIGSGLGGLSCAAAFTRQGFKPLVLEQHDKPGGFATAFTRPGGFRFDVSLHSTGAGERNGVSNLIQGFPEITDVEFILHPNLFRAIFPDHDIRVAQKDVPAYINSLTALFPDEEAGIRGLFDDMGGLATDIQKLSAARGNVDMSRFMEEFPHLAKFHNKTWGEMVDGRIRNPKLKAVVSSQWGYYGLPPSKLSCFYYALPFMGYLKYGGYYPKGRSQDISNAFGKYIEGHGGRIILNSRVSKILLKDGTASGIETSDGREFHAKVVVSNANPFDTFRSMLQDHTLMQEYEERWKEYSVSLSCFQVFLGLKEDLVKKVGAKDSEIFIEPGYDPEIGYVCAQKGDVEHGGAAVSLYDNIDPTYSPAGKNTINILTLQGYDPWEKYEQDYFAGRKERYKKEKERMADILIQRVEERLLPGLKGAIEVKEIGTPLTNLRYTSNYRGAIYGWDQTVNNSGNFRVGHATPVKNLYLAGAWSRPGHGYGAVIPSGLECFAEIMRAWG